MKRKLLWVAAAIPVAVAAFMLYGIWNASSQLLFPVWRGVTKDFKFCDAEAEAHWGKACGNLRLTQEFKFSEVEIPTAMGHALPGWWVKAADQGYASATGVILLVHGGGSDRREMTHHIAFLLKAGFDVLSFDFSCHGEAPCPMPGLTYGERESRDVLVAYRFLAARYRNVYALGSSVGAAAVLMALPEMPGLAAAIVENPFLSFERLISDAPQAKEAPKIFVRLMMSLAMWRGKFGSMPGPEVTMRSGNVPVFFIHAQGDAVIPQNHSARLAEIYPGPKATWFPEAGGHGTVHEANPKDYEKRVADFLRLQGVKP